MQGQNEGSVGIIIGSHCNSNIFDIWLFCFSFNNVSDCIWQSDDETNIDNTESHIDVEQEEPVIVGQEDSIVNPLDPVDMDIESDKENKKDSEDLKVNFYILSELMYIKDFMLGPISTSFMQNTYFPNFSPTTVAPPFFIYVLL